jgi:hypothetical protein
MADKMGINIEDAVMDKVSKNREKYPAEKNFGSSKKYTEL